MKDAVLIIDNARRDAHGALHFGALLPNGHAIWRTYYGFGVREARRKFREDCAEASRQMLVAVRVHERGDSLKPLFGTEKGRTAKAARSVDCYTRAGLARPEDESASSRANPGAK
jgi:hypothetical protein